MRRVILTAVPMLLLAGCAGGQNGNGQPSLGSPSFPLGAEFLSAGDIFLYEGEEALLRLQIGPERMVHDASGRVVTTVPVDFEWSGRGAQPLRKTAFVEPSAREVVGLLSECPLQEMPDGSTKCIDLRVMDYDVAPTSFPLRAFLGPAEGAPRIRISNGEGTSEVSLDVFPAYGSCLRLSPKKETLPIASAMPFLGSEVSYVFCGRVQPPQEIWIGNALLRLVRYVPGTTPLVLEGAAAAQDVPPLAMGPMRATPPESAAGVGSFPISEAYEQAKTHDRTFAAYLEAHPDALLRESWHEGSTYVEGPSANPLSPATLAGSSETRTVAFGPAGAHESHVVRIQKMAFGGTPPLYQVLSSSIETEVVPNPSFLAGTHVTLDAARAMADTLLPTAFAWANVEGAYLDSTGTQRALVDRLHYELSYEGAKVEVGGGSYEFKYSVRVDSRTGTLIRMVGPLEALMWAPS